MRYYRVRRLFLTGLLEFSLLCQLVSPAANADQWTAAQAWDWYNNIGSIRGCNYVPRTAVNSIEMWYGPTFDAATIDQELGWAQSYGYNSTRVFLSYVVWQNDSAGLKDRIGQYLDLASQHGISTTFTLLDDCNFTSRDPYYGPQPDPIPGVILSQWTPSHPASWVTDQNRTNWPLLQNYVQDIINTYKNDNRVLMWDLYNEPGNSGLGGNSTPLMQQAFAWAREVAPSQPLTVASWGGAPDSQAVSLSDVVTFHKYANASATNSTIQNLQATGRPVICSEWMARTLGSTIPTHLPIFEQTNVGWYNWGLVNGRTQCQFPWGSLPGSPEPAVWFHDVLHPDGTPYDTAETTLIQIAAGLIPPPPPGSFTNGGFELNSGNGTVPSGWMALFNTYGAWNGATGPITPHSGSYVMHPGANAGDGGEYQDFITEIGATYLVSLWCVGWPNQNDHQTGKVEIGIPDDSTLYSDNTITILNYTNADSWKSFNFTFTATDTTTRLTLLNVYTGPLSDIYSASAVNFDDVSVIAATKWTGAISTEWNDAANWSSGAPITGSVIEFNAATPTNQPSLQNIAGPLSLNAILFDVGAGTHVLSGQALQLSGNVPGIICASGAEQYIENALTLVGNSTFLVSGVGKLTLSGELSGSGSLVKSGTGTLLISNSAAHTGNTIIEAGILALDTTGQIAVSSILNNAVFQIAAGNHVVADITGNGTTQVDSGAMLNVASIHQGSLIIGSGAKVTIMGITEDISALSLTAVPEPATLILLASGGLVAAAFGWLWRRSKN